MGVTFGLGVSALSAADISDPVKDFLALPIKDRYGSASEIARVTKITVDINGDGHNEIIVGHQKMWLGDNVGIYCAAYSPVGDSGYLRLTSQDDDVAIDSRFFGPRETSYCGFVEEVGTQGLLVLENSSVSRDADGSGKLNQPEQYSSRKFYHIQGDRLIVGNLGFLDLRTPEGSAFFDRYFGKGVESRPIRFEDYPMDRLKELGYAVPDWRRAPPTPAAPAASSLAKEPTKTFPEATGTSTTVSPLAKRSSPEPPASRFPHLGFWIAAVAVIGAIVGALGMYKKK